MQYFGLIPWNSFSGGNFLLILIFGFVFGLWFIGNWVVDRPAKYVKNKISEDAATLDQGAKRWRYRIRAADRFQRKILGVKKLLR